MVTCKFKYLFAAFFLAALSITIKLFPLSIGTKLSLGYSKNSVLNFTERTAINQYTSEEHTVITEDGYVLEIFRMTKAKKCHQTKHQRPVLLMHGLVQNSDIYLDAGIDAGLAYLLSDACFDVWCGNQRGNNYGRKHLRWNPDVDAEFWQFSVDEIGFYDVPATIDYILNYTGVDTVNYVGYSQGSGIFFAMCSERPDYCKKIGVKIGLAPGVMLHHSKSFLMRFVFRSASLFQRMLNLLGVQEVFRKGEFIQEILEYLCQISESTWIEKLCVSGLFMDNFSDSISYDTRRLFFSHVLVGTSVNTLARYGQVMSSGKFQKYDFGAKINLERYNSSVPPEYNLTAVTAPVVFIQGRSDQLVDLEDVYILSNKLPNVLDVTVVSDPKWTHLDMVYSRNTKTMIYPKVYEYLHKYSDVENNSTC